MHFDRMLIYIIKNKIVFVIMLKITCIEWNCVWFSILVKKKME